MEDGVTRNGSQADRIRQCVLGRVIEPARRAGETNIVIKAGEIARVMNLASRVPAVCSVLRGKAFIELAGVMLLERRGPAQSTTTEFHYEIQDRRGRTEPLGDSRHSESPQPYSSDRSRPDDGNDRALYLVSCVKTKLSESAKAKDLYISDWFRKARAYVELRDCPWRILSAKYGAVHPETVVEPYEKTLNAMSADERRAWARSVLAELEPALTRVDTVFFLAGMRYREYLEPSLCQRSLRVIVPMQGLTQGRQLSWLNERLDG